MKPDIYYKESQNYIRFKFEDEEHASAFRGLARLLGMEVDIYHGKDCNYKNSVYINKVRSE